jgi:prepilin-type N-terminal cleavage/methylation domain-containing protein
LNSRSGITLIELMIAMLILGLGVVATLGVLFSTGIHNEINKEQALGYKACQETLEVLTATDYATMINPGSYTPATVNLGTRHFKGFFLVKKPLANDQYIGEFTIRDATADYETQLQTTAPAAKAGLPANMPNWSITEITVSLKVRKVNVMLRTWRRAP